MIMLLKERPQTHVLKISFRFLTLGLCFRVSQKK